jgi:dihydrofolate synthase/folylpolyglutamate synthase
LSEISEILFLKAEKIILTKPANPRSMETEDLSKFVPKSFPKENVFVAESVENSIKKARKISAENDLILITGSLYLVGEAQKILKNESKI